MISKDKNKEFFKLLEDVNSFSHAYLFETNSIKDAYPFVLKFAKKILCENHYIEQDKCGECNICHLIDEGSYSDYYLINPLFFNLIAKVITVAAITIAKIEPNNVSSYVPSVAPGVKNKPVTASKAFVKISPKSSAAVPIPPNNGPIMTLSPFSLSFR